LLGVLRSDFKRDKASKETMRKERTNEVNEQPLASQMNLQFRKSEPVRLPQDKQRELELALADLLLNAVVVEPTPTDKGERR
jgi:hypothetical protein